MDISIIGAGAVGKALANAFTKAGHTVTIASRDPADAAAVADVTGARVAASSADAIVGSDVVVLATPSASAPSIAAEIADAAVGKTVVDLSNRMSFGAAGPEIDTTSSNAEDLAVLLPGAHVVKAFNTLFATLTDDPFVEGVQLDGYVAADDAAAKTQVLELVRSIGLRPVDVGSLPRARQLEALAFLNIAINVANGGTWSSGWKLVGAPETTAVAA
jgi:hypothetical protein